MRDKTVGIKIINFGQHYTAPVVIALGYFDSVHLGHAAVIKKCCEAAELHNALSVVFTFDNNPSIALNGSGNEVFTYEERLNRLSALGAGAVLAAHADKTFLEVSGESFLSAIAETLCVKAVVCGEDYRCGANAAYGPDDVKKFFGKMGITTYVQPILRTDGRKIASRDIREMVAIGDIDSINALLPIPYGISGVVKGGRRDGRKQGIPTANIDFAETKAKLREGVYASVLEFGGHYYGAVTNVGTHPTFDDYVYNVESYVIDTDIDLYGKYVTVYFYSRIRGTNKYADKEQLAHRIMTDIDIARSITNDKIRQ